MSRPFSLVQLTGSLTCQYIVEGWKSPEGLKKWKGETNPFVLLKTDGVKILAIIELLMLGTGIFLIVEKFFSPNRSFSSLVEFLCIF